MDEKYQAPPHAVDSTKAASLSEQALDTDRDLKHDADRHAKNGLASTSSSAAQVASGWLDAVKARVRDNPFASVALVAAAGYVWGATR